ncbi:hypothetical protein [Streptomyces sp. NBC_00519]|uniref:hypothetical protein n=1 Tax=Streptomyces sp. NBC_00519 TaxID=2975764 RepID=UPI0030E0E674
MEPTLLGLLASKAAEHGPTFLGEDLVGWRTALIAAIPAAVAYEVAMALTRKMTLRLPFLILMFARLGMPKAEWEYQGREWKAELWDYLGNRNRHWFLRFIDGMTFAIPLAAGGARLAAKATANAGLRHRAERAPQRGRHAARGRTARFAMRVGVAGGVLSMAGTGVTSSSGKSGSGWPTEPWEWWTLGIVGTLLALLMVFMLSLVVRNHRRASRESDHGE